MNGHRRKADGKPKIGYDTEEQALARANIAAGENAYECRVCRRWHVGHRPGSTFRNQRTASIQRRRRDSY